MGGQHVQTTIGYLSLSSSLYHSVSLHSPLTPSHPHTLTHIVRLKGVEHDYLRHKAADVLTRYLGNKQVRLQLPLHTYAQTRVCVCVCVGVGECGCECVSV